MCKVYLAIPRAPDQLLGHVREDGKIYRSKPGFDEHIGSVDLASGKVYEERFGPDKKIGHVDLSSGKIYLSKLGPDKYVGNVDREGRMHRHVRMGSDEYIGKIDPFISHAHAGGAFLLLVLPASEEKGLGEETD